MGDRLAVIDIGRKEGTLLCPFRDGVAWSPSNTMWPGPKPTSLPSAILIHPAVWPHQTWAKNWGLGPHLTQYGQSRGLPPYQVASWSIQPFGHKRHGPRSAIAAVAELLCRLLRGISWKRRRRRGRADDVRAGAVW